MCGIFGFWLNRKLNPSDIELGNKLTRLLAHRGPDNQKNWYDVDNGVYFGFRRLSIIDLTDNSNQPIVRGNTTLVFNGEIYNFKEIRKNLIYKNYFFKSSGDAEVLINIWREKKYNSLDFLDGMYAFAVYENKKLTLVTDPFGEKPLFYLINKNGVYFSSEIKPLLSIEKNHINLSKSFYKNFMQYGYDLDFNTGFDNIKLMPPATILEFTNPKNYSSKKYWNINKPNEKELKKKFAKQDYEILKSKLINSIDTRLISDVPIGLFLSSGVDSSLIASIIKKELNYNLETYTVSFGGNDETLMSKKISEYLGLKNNVVKPKSKDFYNCENLLSLFGYPNDNLTALSIYLMSEAVSKNIKVALTGLGGDEAFLGYNKYHFIYSKLRMKKTPEYFKIILNFILQNKKIKKSNRINNFLKYFIYENEKKYLYLNNKISAELFDIGKKENEYFINQNNFLNNTINFERNITLPNSYIMANDLGSMRASIETRSPFLSKDIFEFANQFSSKCFFSNGSKTPLRKLLANYLPDQLIDKGKKGFNVPTDIFKLPYNELTSKIFKNTGFKNCNNILDFSEKDKNRIALRLKIIDEFTSLNYLKL
jgi:asparagine synthase (glutamine-hydrolysing)